MTTRAVKVNDRYVVNGSKAFITNGNVADVMLFYAKTDPARGAHGISAFYFLTNGVKGLYREKIKKWGMRSSPTALITFDDMEIPEGNLIGGLNRGGAILTNGLCTERITLSGCSLGSQRACLELSLRYARERIQFGKPISSFQFIQGKLADMYTSYMASRWMAYSAAAYCDSLEKKVGGREPTWTARRPPPSSSAERWARRWPRTPSRSTEAMATARNTRSPGTISIRNSGISAPEPRRCAG